MELADTHPDVLDVPEAGPVAISELRTVFMEFEALHTVLARVFEVRN